MRLWLRTTDSSDALALSGYWFSCQPRYNGCEIEERTLDEQTMEENTSFDKLSLNDVLRGNIRALEYETPTPIQGAAIPPALEGKDVLGLAQTGTGKTAAYAIPVIEGLLRQGGSGLRALVLAPTRELADQIEAEIAVLLRGTPLQSTTVYGGVNIRRQTQILRAGVDILVACPGRLLDLLDRGQITVSEVHVLVIDEVDRMMDMGFLPDVRRIISKLPQERQTLLFSATMPDEVRALADEVLSSAVTVEITPNAPVDAVEHTFFPVAEHLKARLLVEVLYRHQKETASVLIFTRTKQRARLVYKDLLDLGHPVTLLEGDLTQHRRSVAIDAFRAGEKSVLVATDIAARGIDVSGISHVINYDAPETTEAYIHRSGRTGRAGAAGKAFTFVTPADALFARAVEALVGHEIAQCRLEGFPYDEPIHEAAQGSDRRRQAEGFNPGHGRALSSKGQVRRERRSQHR